jgi:hypothetical protein
MRYILREKTVGRGEKRDMESEEEKGEYGNDSNGDYSYKKTLPLIELMKAGGCGIKSASVVEAFVNRDYIKILLIKWF